MQDQDINDIENDETKNFNSIYQTNDPDNQDPSNINFKDSKYFSETDYLNFLKSNKISNENHLKILSLNIANLLSKLSNLKLMIQNIRNR